MNEKAAVQEATPNVASVGYEAISVEYLRLGPPAGSKMVIAGGCGGIGRVLTQAAFNLGIEVVVLDLDASISAHRPIAGIDYHAIDATDETSVQKAFSWVAGKWDRIDSLVNLVGFRNKLADFDQIPMSEWDQVVSGNLRSTVLLCRAAIPLLRAGESATIVNVASSLGLRSVPGHAPYAAAKSAVLNFTRSVAIETAPHIRVNAVAPSAVDTDFHRGGTGRASFTDAGHDPSIFAAAVPLGRIALPGDIIGPILFLAGRQSAFITGQTIVVNGGTW